jgi:hypothetical protein
VWPVAAETGLVDDLREVVVVEVELDPLKAIPAAVTVGVVAVRVDFVAVGAVTVVVVAVRVDFVAVGAVTVVVVAVGAVTVDFVAVGAVTALLCKMEDMILY